MFHQQKPIIMKKIFLFLSMLLAMGLSSACSSDDSKTIIGDCYTGQVKYFGIETGSVQATIIGVPDESILPVGCEVIFNYKELSESTPQVNDIIKFRLVDYSQIKETNGPGLMLRYICKVKPCN